jgi:small subunit ribosomal protein S19
MAEKIAFRGRVASELAGLKSADYLVMVKSRQRRSIRRNGIKYRMLVAKAAEAKGANSTKALKTHVREAVIIPEWQGMKFAVHNGKEFKEIRITANMLGHRLGEYAFTTKRVQHSAPGIRATKGSKFLAVK